MAKKAKTVKRQAKKTRSSSSRSVSNSYHDEQSNFLIIVGGGFIVIVAVLFLLSGSSRHIQKAISKTDTTATTPAVEKNTVVIKSFGYTPSSMTVKAGTKVTFENQDTTAHSATADDGSFDTKVLSQGEKGSFTFTKAGTYSYHCSVHPSMTGTIIVTE